MLFGNKKKDQNNKGNNNKKDKETKEKNYFVLALKIIIFFCLLVPIPVKYKDGGSVRYQACLYSVTKIHALDDSEDGYDNGIRVKLLGIKVYEHHESEQSDFDL